MMFRVSWKQMEGGHSRLYLPDMSGVLRRVGQMTEVTEVNSDFQNVQ